MDPELERTFRGRGAAVTGVSYSPDMKRLVSSGADNNLMVWTFRAQLRVRETERERASQLVKLRVCVSVVFHPFGRWAGKGGAIFFGD